MPALHRMGRPPQLSPRYSTRPYRMHPGRREHIYGKLQPMDEPAEWPMWLKLMVSGAAILAIYVTVKGA